MEMYSKSQGGPPAETTIQFEVVTSKRHQQRNSQTETENILHLFPVRKG